MHEDQNPMRLHAAPGAPLLIAAVTARALAESARRGGFPVVALDCFADQETRASARHASAVASSGNLRFDRNLLRGVARRLAPPGKSAGFVYGSGFESRLPLLGELTSGRRLFGNPVEVVREAKDPDRLFPLLRRLGIPHPEVCRSFAGSPAGWLAKRTGGSGGTHVHPAEHGRAARGIYYQRLAAGEPCSVLFLADGRRAVVLGWNRQWTRPVPGTPYLFGGAVGAVAFPGGVVREISRAVDALVRETGLVGLNGIDFLLDRNRWSLLEVNPRPPATFELYDRDYPRGLFHLHLAACLGRLPSRVRPPRSCRAFSIVPAPAPWVAGQDPLPGWCRDRPVAGTGFRPGEPVCTAHASAATPSAARARAEARRERMQVMIARQAASVAV